MIEERENNMKQDTLKITMGGMFVGIFAMLLVINRQTGMMFEELIFYLLPIPMVAYSAKWGFKTSLPVLAAMALISLIFGNITTIFYAVTEALIGLVFGSRIYKKADMTRTLLIVIVLSVVVNLLNTIIFASLFGYNLTEEITELREMMFQAYDTAGQMTGVDNSAMMEQMSNLLTPAYLMRALVVSMILLGAIQGILVYYLSLLILNRLRFQLPKPKPLSTLYPPKWTGYLAMLAFLGYIFTAGRVIDDIWGNLIQTCGMCGMFYLIIFGVFGIMLLAKVYLSPKPIVGILLGFLGFFMMPQIVVLIGIIYINTDFHQSMMARIK